MDDNPNFLKIIQPSQDDIDFWSYQLCEHSLFLKMLLDPNVVPDLQMEANYMYDQWYKLVQTKPIKYNTNLLTSLYAFLETIHNKISKHIKLTLMLSIDDFHALITHMIFEQTYFVRLVEGKMTLKHELMFWLQENSQHTALFAHQLPPGDTKTYITEISNLLKRNKVIAQHDPSYLMYELKLLTQSNNAANYLHDEIHAGNIKGIDDSMLEHEMREAIRGEQRVKMFLEQIKL